MDSIPDNWDPMLEAFESGKNYATGPGADLQNSDELDQGTKIFIRGLPEGITTQGVKHLCSSCGKPLAVHITECGRSAVVKFRTRNEAHLAIRDLNNTPPYFLKVTYSRSENYKKSPKVSADDGNESWPCTSIYKHFMKDKLQLNKVLNKNVKSVPPYFHIKSEFDNPTLVMRQKCLDFETKKQCISMGRGYFNRGDVDIYKCENFAYSEKSDNWEETDQDITKCFACGSITFKRHADQAENVCSRECEFKTSQDSKSNVFHSFSPGVLCTVETFRDVTDIRVPCTVIPEGEINNYKLIGALTTTSLEVISAKKGEMVIVCDFADRCQRGIVIHAESNSYRVALIDSGMIMSVDKVYSLSSDLEDVPQFAGILTFLEEPFSDLKSVKFCVKEEKYFGSWLCDMIKQDTGCVIGEVTLEEWSPVGLKFVPLTPKCTVVMTMYRDMGTVFVRRTDESWQENFVRLCNEVAACSFEGRRYVDLPKLGEMCSARFDKDGCFYRAVVQAVKMETITVTFVDFGNDQDTKLEDLRYLPDAARRVSCFAVPVRVKDVPQTSTPESVKYYNQLVAYETELTLTYEGEYPGDVTLTEITGNVVNKVVADLMVPVWERDPSVFTKSGKPYFLGSVSEFLFNPGETRDVFLLNFNAEEFKTCGSFWATPYKNECLCHLNGELKRQMTEYCNYLAKDRYRPRVEELCIVEHKGDWYRGVCVNDLDELCDVFLIDFGISISVETKSIRKILKEFLEMPALALECTISGYGMLAEDIQSQIVEYMESMNKKCLQNVNITGKIRGVYQLLLPHMEAAGS
ncbi:UNVERIFIED_CONTAM: hypothetical protein PYX00_010214 [Menopon gallinae]|uniref:Tudor domain-containing protein 1 n=1 Tax=Menopon gallinae TaxID=328185 RepID=A0AAW2HEN4_9NEOP